MWVRQMLPAQAACCPQGWSCGSHQNTEAQGPRHWGTLPPTAWSLWQDNSVSWEPAHQGPSWPSQGLGTAGQPAALTPSAITSPEASLTTLPTLTRRAQPRTQVSAMCANQGQSTQKSAAVPQCVSPATRGHPRFPGPATAGCREPAPQGPLGTPSQDAAPPHSPRPDAHT